MTTRAATTWTRATRTERDPQWPDSHGGRTLVHMNDIPQNTNIADESGETLGSATPQPGNSAERDPQDWVTGEEPMTGAQRSYLDTLAREAGEELPADLTKAEASEHIDRLQGSSNRVPEQE